MTLDTTIDSKVNEDSNIVSVGMEGICITKLSLTGNAKFGDNIVEVTSERGYINENTSIIITKIEGNKIIVKPNN